MQVAATGVEQVRIGMADMMEAPTRTSTQIPISKMLQISSKVQPLWIKMIATEKEEEEGAVDLEDQAAVVGEWEEVGMINLEERKK